MIFHSGGATTFDDEKMTRRDQDKFIVLTYQAKAIGKTKAEYNVFCSSTYMFNKNGYTLILHQQTPNR